MHGPTSPSSPMAIFNEALDLGSPGERAAYLDRACGGDPALRARVETLLAAHERAGGFLEDPALVTTDSSEPRRPIEDIGTVIGPYTLLEQIGEGGMGVVYVAEQTRPVRRKVALKVIKPGMDSKQVVARFEAERQALALMDHPNIATVHDAGTTDTGRPYFVMELVRGIPVTDYCDREQFSIPERLDLFVLICRAVQHAHQKGIIHRDLKPSNILVTVVDGAAVPKVIDFGIAKATGPALTDRSVYTAFHQFVGTPLYMSPEQADLSGVDVDTRSDIYSLGVLLYEMLTGTTPFDRERFGAAAFDEMRRIIREEEPPRPSTRLSSLAAMRTTVSANRKADARQLDRTICGELDWIVMKALEKDRRSRYETANDFATDVMRYLFDEPVEACPPSARYRFTKFVRRNRAGLTTITMVAMALVVGTGVSLWQAARAREAAREARERTEESRQVVEYLSRDVFGIAAPGKKSGGRSVTVGELLDRADATLGERFRGKPLVEASVRMALADSYGILMDQVRAETNAARAVEIRERYLGPEHPATLEALALEAWSLNSAGWYFEEDRINPRAAEPIARRVLAGRLRMLGPAHPDTLSAQVGLAVIVSNLGRQEAAEDLAAQADALCVRFLGPENEVTLSARFTLGLIAQRRGNLDRAEALLRHVLAAYEQTVGSLDLGSLNSLYALAHTVALQGRAPEARRLNLEIVNRCIKVYGLCHIRTSRPIRDLCSLLWKERDFAAIRDLCEGWIREILASPPDLDPYERLRRSVRLGNVALTLATLPEGIPIDAALAVHAAEQNIGLCGCSHDWATLGTTHYRAGHLDDALRAMQTSQQKPRWQGGDAYYWTILAAIQARRGDLVRSHESYKKSLTWDIRSVELRQLRSETETLLGLEPPRTDGGPETHLDSTIIPLDEP